MDKELQRVLEYDKIRFLLREEAGSSLGRELAEKLLPSADRAEIEGWLAETAADQIGRASCRERV